MRADGERAVTAVLTAMAEEIAASAPPGWKRAWLRGYATGPDAVGHHGFWFEPDEVNKERPDDIIPFDGMRELHALMQAAEQLTIELELDARGRYRAVLSERLDRSGRRAFRYLLDGGSEPFEVGEPRRSSDASEAGDPDDAVTLLGDFLRALGELLGPNLLLDLPSPLPRARREQLVSGLGVALPRDLRALYGMVDGDGGRGLLNGYRWFGVEMLATLCRAEERWWVTRGWRRYLNPAFIKEFGPLLTVQRLTDHPGWIPFATDMFGNYLAVDMAPGPRGRPGQVILIGRDHDDGPTYVADSVTSLLRAQVEALATGSFELDDDGLWLNSGDPEQYKRDYDRTCTLEVAGSDAAPVRGMRLETRELTVRNAPWVDLGPVRGAPALWRVAVENCPGVDLAALHDTPVEVIDLALGTIDLAGLEGHPTVRKVVLHSEKPVDLRPLLSCPRLYALDLTDVVTADVCVLADATGLRYLKMRPGMWESLFRHESVPASLAVAELAEEPPQERKLYWSFDRAYKRPRPTLRDAVSWARRLTGNDTDIRTFTGRIRTSRSG